MSRRVEVYNLFRIDFDGMENHIGNAIDKKLIATFWDGREGTAHLKCNKYLNNNILPYKPYMGWNKEIYPKFIVEVSYNYEEEI